MKHRANQFICRIDVNGFATVMLALLALFIHPALFQDRRRGSVDLAKANNATPMRGALREDALIVAVERDGTVYWRDDRVTASMLPSLIRDGLANGAERRIYVKVDARAKYGSAVDAIDSIRSAGITDIVFLVDPRPR